MEGKNYWKRLNREYAKYLEDDCWRRRRILKLEHTGLFPVNEVGQGPNSGEPTLLSFQTILIEVTAIHFQYDSRFNSLMIYYSSSTDSYGDNHLFEIRKDNKTQDFIYNRREDELPWLLKRLVTKDDQIYGDDSVVELLEKHGYKILVNFKFNEKLSFRMPHHCGYSIHPEYIKTSQRSLEIGWISSGTYNSLPSVLKLTKSKGFNTVSLSDLGIETEGYYDHHYNCEILVSQSKQAKAFFRRRFKQKSA